MLIACDAHADQTVKYSNDPFNSDSILKLSITRQWNEGCLHAIVNMYWWFAFDVMAAMLEVQHKGIF